MTDLERILSLWRELEVSKADFVLASVIAVEGPSYRKPGALMLLAPDGRRAGTVSGGCLEAEVASRAWWLTGDGPTVQRYSTADEDGERPYGSGCGGVVFLLLERRATAAPLLAALEQGFQRRIPLAVATIVEGHHQGRRAFAGIAAQAWDESELNSERAQDEYQSLQELAEGALAERGSKGGEVAGERGVRRVWADFRPPRPGLGIFGAGDDAQPLLRMAKELGWYASVADGRSHLATRERFPLADEAAVLAMRELPAAGNGLPAVFGNLRSEDAAVVMTHSFEQDAKILACLLSLDAAPAYVGVLGPQRRTREVLVEAAHLLGMQANGAAAQAERWLAGLHAPTGLDLGAESPETIALSVLAEIQKFRTASSALPLRTVRAAGAAVAG